VERWWLYVSDTIQTHKKTHVNFTTLPSEISKASPQPVCFLKTSN
jgi:hypothetical protein